MLRHRARMTQPTLCTVLPPASTSFAAAASLHRASSSGCCCGLPWAAIQQEPSKLFVRAQPTGCHQLLLLLLSHPAAPALPLWPPAAAAASDLNGSCCFCFCCCSAHYLLSTLLLLFAEGLTAQLLQRAALLLASCKPLLATHCMQPRPGTDPCCCCCGCWSSHIMCSPYG